MLLCSFACGGSCFFCLWWLLVLLPVVAHCPPSSFPSLSVSLLFPFSPTGLARQSGGDHDRFVEQLKTDIKSGFFIDRAVCEELDVDLPPSRTVEQEELGNAGAAWNSRVPPSFKRGGKPQAGIHKRQARRPHAASGAAAGPATAGPAMAGGAGAALPAHAVPMAPPAAMAAGQYPAGMMPYQLPGPSPYHAYSTYTYPTAAQQPAPTTTTTTTATTAFAEDQPDAKRCKAEPPAEPSATESLFYAALAQPPSATHTIGFDLTSSMRSTSPTFAETLTSVLDVAYDFS